MERQPRVVKDTVDSLRALVDKIKHRMWSAEKERDELKAKLESAEDDWIKATCKPGEANREIARLRMMVIKHFKYYDDDGPFVGLDDILNPTDEERAEQLQRLKEQE